jgi:hypothetical protein
MAHKWIAEFLYARAHVVDELHAEGKGDADIAQALSMNADEVLLTRTRQREGDLDP